MLLHLGENVISFRTLLDLGLLQQLKHLLLPQFGQRPLNTQRLVPHLCKLVSESIEQCFGLHFDQCVDWCPGLHLWQSDSQNNAQFIGLHRGQNLLSVSGSTSVGQLAGASISALAFTLASVSLVPQAPPLLACQPGHRLVAWHLYRIMFAQCLGPQLCYRVSQSIDYFFDFHFSHSVDQCLGLHLCYHFLRGISPSTF